MLCTNKILKALYENFIISTANKPLPEINICVVRCSVKACCTGLDSTLKHICGASPGAGGENQGRGCAHWCCFPLAGHKHKNVPQQPLGQPKQQCSSEPLHAGSLLTNNHRYKKCRDAVKPCWSRVSASAEAAGRISPHPQLPAPQHICPPLERRA